MKKPSSQVAEGNVPVPAAAADSRLRGILHGGASSIAQKAMGMAISLVSVPLTARYLGVERYGIWVTISSLVFMVSIMDLGIANTLTNMISKAYAHDDRHSARLYYATAFWSSLAISIVLGIVAVFVWPHLDWLKLFKLHDPELGRQAAVCVAIALGFFLLTLPLNLINRVLSGYQQTQITNYFGVLSNLLGLVAILISIRMHGSLVTLMLIYSVALLSGNLCLNAWVNLWDRPWLLPHPNAVGVKAVRSLLGSGAGFFLLQIAGLVVFNSDNIVITHYLGPAAVVPYSVTFRLANYATLLQSAIFPSMWPAYAEAYERADYAWVRRMFWIGVRYGLGTTLAAVLGLIAFGQPLIRWYIGPAAVPSEVLVVAIGFWTLLCAGMNLEACFLAAINRVKMQGALSIVAAVLNLGLSIYLVKRIGSVGVVLGTIVSYVLVLVGPQTWIVWRGLYHPPARSPESMPVAMYVDETELQHEAL